jgi:hypothetical protein
MELQWFVTLGGLDTNLSVAVMYSYPDALRKGHLDCSKDKLEISSNEYLRCHKALYTHTKS